MVSIVSSGQAAGSACAVPSARVEVGSGRTPRRNCEEGIGARGGIDRNAYDPSVVIVPYQEAGLRLSVNRMVDPRVRNHALFAQNQAVSAACLKRGVAWET